MSDIRNQVYKRYVSTLKKDEIGADGQEERYHRWCSHKVLPLIKGAARNGPVLEIGCGHGPMMRFLQAQGFADVTGVDLSAEMVALAVKTGLNVIEGDARDELKRRKGQLELVTAFDVVEHFTKTELLELFGSIRDSLRPGGRFVFQAPNGEGLFPNQVQHGDLTHMTVLTPSSVTQLLTLCGFAHVQVVETGPAATSWRGHVRMALWGLIRGGANAIRLIETGKTQAVWTESMLGVATVDP